MQELLGINGHIVLYCKNHYKHSNSIIEDLKKIWAIRCGYDYDSKDNTMVKNIIDNLYMILKPYISNEQRFQENLHEHLLSWMYKDLNTAERLIYFYCSELANLQVRKQISDKKWEWIVKLPKPKKKLFNRILAGNGKYDDYKLINS